MADKYYFGYFRNNGTIYCMKWHEDTPVSYQYIEGTKVTITEQEFYSPLDVMKERYPYKE